MTNNAKSAVPLALVHASAEVQPTPLLQERASLHPKTTPTARRRARAAPAPRWISSSIYRGCNVHHDRTVLSVVVDLGVLHGRTSGSAGPDFASRFVARFFDLAQTPPTAPSDESFLDALRLPDGVPFEQVLLKAIVCLERRLAFASRDFVPIGMSRVERVGSRQAPRQTRLVWESRHPGQSRAAAKLALAGMLTLLPESLNPRRSSATPEPLDFDAEWAGLWRRARRRQTSNATAAIALAANARGIPCESMGGPHLQLGHAAAQHVVYSSVPTGTTLAASQLSRNKQKTSKRLAQLGLPVTKQIAVESAEEALAAAEKLGYPVVVKPRKGKQAGGVSVGIARAEEIDAAFARAGDAGSGVLVEEFVHGATFRLLVIAGRFAAALEVTVPTVVGDGKSRIDELIDALNRDPMRNDVRLYKVKVDDELRASLARSGLTPSDVPPARSQIALRTAANVAIGGVHKDVTDLVHPSHRELAERAAMAIGLSVAGIDVVTPDISRSCDEVGSKVIEVNARPGLDMHVFPRYGQGRDVAGAMLELAFPPGATGGIPTALVIGQRGAGAVARSLDAILRERGNTTGLITRKAALAAGQTLAIAQPRLHQALAVMRRDSRLQALVVATTPRRAVARGLVLERADAVALLAPDARDAAVYGQAAALAVRVARGPIVVDVGNEPALQLLQEMLTQRTLERARLILVSTRTDDASVDAHVAAGGPAVVRESARNGDRIVVRRRDKRSVLLRSETATDPTRGKRARLFASALAWALRSSMPHAEAAASGNARALGHSNPAISR